MPYELQKAHRANDAASLEAYGFPKDAAESDIVARLFKMYQELTNIISHYFRLLPIFCRHKLYLCVC